MKLVLLSVGKPRDAALAGLHDRYVERIRRLGASYATATVPDVAGGGQYSDDHVRERESKALLAAAEGHGSRVALDRSGTLFTSEEIAAKLERWSQPSVAFLIGGPLGHSQALLARCEAAWSLSPLTLPHELVRVIVAEQLYRALSIRRGTPYHK
jgi:23S rRNA (pseudouridine1915-N3)-methyltransferase